MINNTMLIETRTYDAAAAEVILEEGVSPDAPKKVYMKGIFIEGDIVNQNGRMYPLSEIRKAVEQMNKAIKDDNGVLGECDHPQELQIHLDRVSHKITQMWMDGAKGYGKLQLLPTPCGNIVKTLIDCGVKLGVSSRGSGNVDDNGRVSDFDMLTVDIVAKPSAPNAYPTPVYEALMNRRHGWKVHDIAESIQHDATAQKHLKRILLGWVDELKLR